MLFWVAQDKSNAAIAKVLDCCEGTVRKHLEPLYKKTGSANPLKVTLLLYADDRIVPKTNFGED